MDFQAWLDRWADTVVAGDYAAFRAMTALPFRMLGPGQDWTVDSEAQMAANFDAYHRTIIALGATMMVRTLRESRMLADDRAELVFDNDILRGAQRIFEPTRTRVWLRREGDAWLGHQLQDLPSDGPTDPALPALDTHALVGPARRD